MNVWLLLALGTLLAVALYFVIALAYDLIKATRLGIGSIELDTATIGRLVRFTNLTPTELKSLPRAELEMLSTAALLVQDVLAERNGTTE